jgi:hypothetical protein
MKYTLKVKNYHDKNPNITHSNNKKHILWIAKKLTEIQDLTRFHSSNGPIISVTNNKTNKLIYFHG